MLALSSLGYAWGRRRALSLADRPGSGKLHSRPVHYGGLVALWVGVPAAAILLLWLIFNGGVVERLVLASVPSELLQAEGGHVDLLLERIRQADPSDTSSALGRAAARMDELQSRSVQFGFVLVSLVAAAGLLVTVRRIHPRLRARNEVEWLVGLLLAGCSVIAILTTIGIVLSVLFEALRFFQEVPFTEFLFGTTWSPQTAIRSDQVGSSGAFGAVPLFAGTLMISAIAMLVSVPVGLMSAIYLAEYASKRVRAVAKPVLEILAGVPTVVYGFFAALTVAPALRNAGVTLGLDVSSESALAAGLVMGIMIIPFISSLSDDVITAVPESLRSGSLGLGATHSETIRKVVLPAALPGIVGGILLGVSRAIGETMIVVMAAGLAANLTANPLESVTTVTVQIVTLLVGDQEFDSPKTLAAFALGLVLFVMTLLLNVLALYVVRKYREQYD
ncbi:MAG: phosphate ABC transporter permease subunit PstC [Xanthomonadales bacterium]|nr:phosphate ABC transporter permease subunit PstC [Xanthomonadales bacterium]